MMSVSPKLRPVLDPEFLPAALWQRAYRALVAADPGARPFALVLVRNDGAVFRHESRVLSATHPSAALTLIYAERLLKFLLWMKGGPRVLVAGAAEIAAELAKLSGWAWEHDALAKTFEFADFRDALAFMVRAGFEAEALNHHPEWMNVYETVAVRLTTHDAGGKVTTLDFELAQRMDHCAA